MRIDSGRFGKMVDDEQDYDADLILFHVAPSLVHLVNRAATEQCRTPRSKDTTPRG